MVTDGVVVVVEDGAPEYLTFKIIFVSPFMNIFPSIFVSTFCFCRIFSCLDTLVAKNIFTFV